VTAKKATKKRASKKTTKKAGGRIAKKTTKKPKNKPKPTPENEPKKIQIPDALLKSVVRALALEGDSEDEIRIRERGYGDEVVDAAIEEAQRRFRRVSGIDRLAEIGAGIVRLRQIIGRAIAGGELTQAIQAQRELGKLLALYPKAGEGEGNRPPEVGSEAQSELEAIAAHLRPLELADGAYPLSEIARIAAEIIHSTEAKK